MAGISKKTYKNSAGKTIVKYVITYRDIFGKQHTAGGYRTKAEALKHINDFESVDPKSKNVTYGAIFKAFSIKVEKYAESTKDTYSRLYEDFFNQFDKIPYIKIQSINWQEFFNEIEEKRGPYIAQAALKYAKAAANFSKKHGLIEINVFDRIEKPESPKADINHLTADELKKVLEICRKLYKKHYALLFTFIGTGAREGEIFALEKSDFDYIGKTITINKQFTKGRLIPKPKTSHSNRKIFLFDELREVLREHIKTLDPDNPLLFPNGAGNYHNPSNFRERFFYPLLEQCEIKKRVRLHDLRGSYIDLVLSQGLSIKFAQNQAGHAKSETTLNIYAKNNQDMIQNAQSVLNDTFKKCEPNVSQKENPPNKKIIRFPKRVADTGF